MATTTPKSVYTSSQESYSNNTQNFSNFRPGKDNRTSHPDAEDYDNVPGSSAPLLVDPPDHGGNLNFSAPGPPSPVTNTMNEPSTDASSNDPTIEQNGKAQKTDSQKTKRFSWGRNKKRDSQKSDSGESNRRSSNRSNGDRTTLVKTDDAVAEKQALQDSDDEITVPLGRASVWTCCVTPGKPPKQKKAKEKKSKKKEDKSRTTLPVGFQCNGGSENLDIPQPMRISASHPDDSKVLPSNGGCDDNVQIPESVETKKVLVMLPFQGKERLNSASQQQGYGQGDQRSHPVSQQESQQIFSDLGASVTVSLREEMESTKRSIRGYIPLNGKIYAFAPISDALDDMDSMTFDRKSGSSEDAYVLTEESLDTSIRCDVRYDATAFSGVEEFDQPSHSRTTKTTYTVEMLIVADWAIYKKWYGLSKKPSDAEKSKDAQRQIVYYFTHVANGVNMRYASLRQPDYDLVVRLVGVFIAMDKSKSPFTEGEGIRLDFKTDVYTNMNKGLDFFQKWVTTFALKNGRFFDQATLFTGNLMYDGTFVNGRPNAKSGLANMGQICNIGKTEGESSLSVSINRDKGIYGSITTAAHELAHNLGSEHDIVNLNGCSSEDQFIMSVAPGTLKPATFKHPFNFSSCSVKYISNFIKKLGKDNCLLQTSPSSAVTLYTRRNEASQPGQQYTADDQCKQIVGDTSYYCAGESRDQQICQFLICWEIETKQCVSRTEMRAYDGTTCGNRMWCMMGQCVKDNNAPATKTDTCIYGDRKDKIIYSGNVQAGCSDLAGANVWRCYENYTMGECCQTCPKLRDTSKTGCEYGNRDPTYCAANVKKANCYDVNFVKTCCTYCATQKGTQVGCEYGDKAAWCKDVTRDKCYRDAKTCCESCEKFKTNIKGCEYGDQQDFCSQQPIKDVCGTYPAVCCSTCKNFHKSELLTRELSNVLDLLDLANQERACADGDAGFCGKIKPDWCYGKDPFCCASCEKLKTGSSGCEYGDKADWCATFVKGPEQCKDKDVQATCCKACAKSKRGMSDSIELLLDLANLERACADADAGFCGKITPDWCYGKDPFCCASCEKLKSGPSGCEYGDKADWCAKFVKGSEQCKDKEVQATCCKSCAKSKREMSNYMDLERACADADAGFCGKIKPDWCYGKDPFCCASCEKLKSGPSGCEYGDKADWCATFVKGPEQCKDKDVQATCCKACAKSKKVSDKLDNTIQLLKDLLSSE